MMLASHGDQIAQTTEERYLSRLMPVLLGLGLGMLVAGLVASGSWQYAAIVVLAVPAAVVLLHYPFVAVLTWVLILPFFIEGGSSIAVQAYWVFHRLLIPAALAITILNDWLGLRRRPPVRFGASEWVLLTFGAFALANVLLLSADPMRSLVRLYDLILIPIGLYLLVRLTAPDERDLKRLAWAAFVVAVAQTAIGVLGWVAPGLLPEQWKSLVGARATGTFSGPAVYTVTLVFLACLLTHHASLTTSRLQRLASQAAIGLAFLGVFISFSRGSWLGGVVVFLALFAVYPRVLRSVAIVGMLSALLLGGTLLAGSLEFARERLTSETTAEDRLIGVNASIRMIAERPLAGWGFGDYSLYDDRFKTRVLNIEARDDSTSHNSYLSMMAEMGLIGLGLYAFAPMWWLALSARAWRQLPAAGYLSQSLLIALWLALADNFIVGNFMDMIRHQQYGTGIWWLSLGLVANLVYPRLRRVPPARPRSAKTRADCATDGKLRG